MNLSGERKENMIDYEETLGELANAFGIQLAFGEDDMCELVIGDATVLSIERRPDAGTILMTSVAADALPDPVDYALVLDLLDFSLGAAVNGTPAIGRDPVSGLVVAHQTVTAKDLQKAAFSDIVKDFLAFREVMGRKLAGSGENA